MDTITESNLEQKMDEIWILIRIWGPRPFTPLVKITITKSKIKKKMFEKKKIVHVLLPLPSQKYATLSKVEEIYQNLIWGSKP